MKIGAAVASITSTSSRLASSLPSTSSWFVSRVMSSRMSVFLSFSCATLLAARSAARNVSRASCSGARMKNKIDPNLAMSPTLRMICVPASTSHAVHISTNSAVPYTPRYRKCCGRRERSPARGKRWGRSARESQINCEHRRLIRGMLRLDRILRMLARREATTACFTALNLPVRFGLGGNCHKSLAASMTCARDAFLPNNPPPQRI